MLEVVLQRIDKDAQLPESLDEIMNNFEQYFPSDTQQMKDIFNERQATLASKNKKSKRTKSNSNSNSNSMNGSQNDDEMMNSDSLNSEKFSTSQSSSPLNHENSSSSSSSSSNANQENNENDFGVNEYELFQNEFKMKKAKELITKGVCARMVKGIVNRKVIKQTVMTSVYGVTRLGARLQVQSKLEEKIVSLLTSNKSSSSEVEVTSENLSSELLETLVAADDSLCTNELITSDGNLVAAVTDTSDMSQDKHQGSEPAHNSSVPGPAGMDMELVDKSVFQCSRYVANCTLDSLADVFYSAQLIMDWLADCASKLAEYVSFIDLFHACLYSSLFVLRVYVALHTYVCVRIYLLI